MQYLYEIKNIINNKRYISRTCNPDIRKKRHFRELEKNKHHCMGNHLLKSINKKFLKLLEGRRNLQNQLKKIGFLILVKNLGIKEKKTGPLSLEHKQKLSAKNTGKPPTNIRPVICEKYFFLSIYEAAKAYKISSTGILTRIKSKSKQFDSFYYFDKSCDNKNKYIRYSPETFSSSLIGKGHLSSKKVFCEGQIFNSLKEASNFYNISRETIRQRCKSNNKNWKEFYIIEE